MFTLVSCWFVYTQKYNEFFLSWDAPIFGFLSMHYLHSLARGWKPSLSEWDPYGLTGHDGLYCEDNRTIKQLVIATYATPVAPRPAPFFSPPPPPRHVWRILSRSCFASSKTRNCRQSYPAVSTARSSPPISSADRTSKDDTAAS